CNSYNKTAVAAACDISFVRPAYSGDTLTAQAVEQFKAGRNGIYDVTVTNQNNQTIALFRGKSRVISKTGPLDDVETR
ncbi:MAG TPA: phenylacetic acid degradation protein PaaD, partial [Rhizobiales bacterium]|nr:phenylacetic acid degradation protein PaaD [Hyphomicrobiales bacterium]